jgi:hypothetical protein
MPVGCIGLNPEFDGLNEAPTTTSMTERRRWAVVADLHGLNSQGLSSSRAAGVRPRRRRGCLPHGRPQLVRARPDAASSGKITIHNHFLVVSFPGLHGLHCKSAKGVAKAHSTGTYCSDSMPSSQTRHWENQLDVEFWVQTGGLHQ